MLIGTTFLQNMNKLFTLIASIGLSFTGICQDEAAPTKPFSLNDFNSENEALDAKVDAFFTSMSEGERVAQLLMPAMGRLGETEENIMRWTREHKIGGVLLLNGSKEQFTTWVKNIEGVNSETGALPFLFSADAEPTLVNRKITGSTPVKKAADIHSEAEVRLVATTISKELNDIGINYNFAPVVDMSGNATVGYRGFGANPENILPWSEAFIAVTQEQGIVATAKHFPGHGLVSGDTHKSLQVINGELKELKYYPPLVAKGVLSIMVGHLAVRNNPSYDTEGLPATLSEKMVQGLLRDSLGFKGLIVTDAMNMGGVSNVEGASWKAVAAGCDIVLMPLNVDQSHKDILARYQSDADFRKKVDASAKRIIRMKMCLGLL